MVSHLAAAPQFSLHSEKVMEGRKADAATSPTEITIGDPVRVTLQATDTPPFDASRIEAVEWDPDEEIWHVESNWRRDWQPDAKAKVGPWHATLRPFDTGQLALPTATVTYRTDDGRATQTVAAASLDVAATMGQSADQAQLAPLRAPAELPRDYRPLILAALIVLGIAILLYVIFRALRHRKQGWTAPSEPGLPPGLWALEEIERRSRLPVNDTGPAKVIFSHASEVVRVYLGRRYDIAAMDMTTGETLRALRELPAWRRPSDEIAGWMKAFLEECDLVKFTNIEPPRDRWKKIWHDARLIVRATTPAEELGDAPAEISAPDHQGEPPEPPSASRHAQREAAAS